MIFLIQQRVFHLHPMPGLHPLFETLGYMAAFAVYRWLRGRQQDVLDERQRWNILAAAAVGALIGSRLLGILEQLPRLHPWTWRVLLIPGGKTIVGALLGGWLLVEIAKRVSRIHNRTGDLFAIPLCVGIAVGRIGCFVAGMADDTYGKATSLPWAMDFGDGVGRHPTQIYEIVFLTGLAGALYWMSRRPHREGSLFRVFMAAYLGFRLFVDFWKPQPLVGGLNWIQWGCLAGLVAVGLPLVCKMQTLQRATVQHDR